MRGGEPQRHLLRPRGQSPPGRHEHLRPHALEEGEGVRVGSARKPRRQQPAFQLLQRRGAGGGIGGLLPLRPARPPPRGQSAGSPATPPGGVPPAAPPTRPPAPPPASPTL